MLLLKFKLKEPNKIKKSIKTRQTFNFKMF